MHEYFFDESEPKYEFLFDIFFHENRMNTIMSELLMEDNSKLTLGEIANMLKMLKDCAFILNQFSMVFGRIPFDGLTVDNSLFILNAGELLEKSTEESILIDELPHKEESSIVIPTEEFEKVNEIRLNTSIERFNITNATSEEEVIESPDSEEFYLEFTPQEA